jgi:hypothetical protein
MSLIIVVHCGRHPTSLSCGSRNLKTTINLTKKETVMYLTIVAIPHLHYMVVCCHILCGVVAVAARCGGRGQS